MKRNKFKSKYKHFKILNMFYNWKIRKQFNYNTKKHNIEKVKIFNTTKKYYKQNKIYIPNPKPIYLKEN